MSHISASLVIYVLMICTPLYNSTRRLSALREEYCFIVLKYDFLMTWSVFIFEEHYLMFYYVM